MSKIIEKLGEYLTAVGVSPSRAEVQIKASNGTLSKPLSKGTEIKTDTLEKFLNTFDVNPLWLFSENAEGIPMKISDMIVTTPEMVKESDPNYKVFKLRTDNQVIEQSIPLYNLEATAGLVELFRDHKDIEPIDTIHIPNLPKCDGAVFVAGDSMYPLLKSGDIVMYKQVSDIKNDIFWGQMYLVSIASNGDEYVMVKYIQKSNKGDRYITLVSENRHHQDKDIKIDKIRALALIKASVRINAMN